MARPGSLLAASCLWLGAGAAAAPAPKDAVFCHRYRAHGAVDAFAGRILSGNRLLFRIDRWDSAGQTFSAQGIARPVGGHWVHDGSSDAGRCRMTIQWRGRKGVSGSVDPKAPCDGEAAPGFNDGVRSFHLGAGDYRRRVRHELDPDSDGFLADLPC